MPARPLFVTRKFPPSLGGMQTLAEEVWRALEECPDAQLIAFGGDNRRLATWLPRALAGTVRALRDREVDVVLAGDALMFAALAPAIAFARRLWQVETPVIAMVHGLDVTYENRCYQAAIRRTLPRAAQVLAIGEAAAAATRSLGVEGDRVRVVPSAVHADDVRPADRVAASKSVREVLGVRSEDILLLTLGRLVRRKGARWFIEHVLPGLPPGVVYAVAGTGPEEEAVRHAASQAGVAGRVHVLGRVNDESRELLLRGADVFVQPNIAVPGDIEGFGLVLVEAAIRGTPVVAARVDGIPDAIADGETGLLCAPGDAGAWIQTLTELTSSREDMSEAGARFGANARERYEPARLREALWAVLEAVAGGN